MAMATDYARKQLNSAGTNEYRCGPPHHIVTMKRAAESRGRKKPNKKRKLTSDIIDRDALLQLVKEREFLYAQNHPSWRNYDLKRAAWKEIADELGCTVDLVQAKWRNFKDCYLRYRKYVVESKMARRKYKVWKYADVMKFMRPYTSKFVIDDVTDSTDDELAFHDKNLYMREIRADKISNSEKKQAFSTIDVDEVSDDFQIIDSDNDLDEDEFDESFDQPKSTKDFTSAKFDEPLDQSKSTIQDLTSDIICRANPVKLDEEDLKFLNYSKIIKKFPPNRQSMVKYKIAEIIMKMETECLMLPK